MKAVILAAGKGTRMKPLTEDTPKPLLPVAGKPIIQHNIEKLEQKVQEIIIVAGYKKNQFEEKYGEKENIRIVEQEKALGTAHAALQAKEYIEGKTVILNGDDIYNKKDIENALEKESSVLAAERQNPEEFGVFKIQNGKITELEEKPDNPPSQKVNTGFYVVQPEFFNYLEKVEKSERGEYE
ncbi:MAG: sugar phosphate nucleotidyltransferase, partial [Candidatus Nanohaloarchaea archaeon]